MQPRDLKDVLDAWQHTGHRDIPGTVTPSMVMAACDRRVALRMAAERLGRAVPDDPELEKRTYFHNVFADALALRLGLRGREAHFGPVELQGLSAPIHTAVDGFLPTGRDRALLVEVKTTDVPAEDWARLFLRPAAMQAVLAAAVVSAALGRRPGPVDPRAALRTGPVEGALVVVARRTEPVVRAWQVAWDDESLLEEGLDRLDRIARSAARAVEARDPRALPPVLPPGAWPCRGCVFADACNRRRAGLGPEAAPAPQAVLEAAARYAAFQQAIRRLERRADEFRQAVFAAMQEAGVAAFVAPDDPDRTVAALRERRRYTVPPGATPEALARLLEAGVRLEAHGPGLEDLARQGLLEGARTAYLQITFDGGAG